MSKFDEGYKLCLAKAASPQLKPLIARVYNNIHMTPCPLLSLKESIAGLLEFLCEPQNKNKANCSAVDLFFAIPDHWEIRWGNLPQEYQDILEDIGGALHDTVAAPAVAENFGSTPEQLLARANALKT